MTKKILTNDWEELLQEEFSKPYYIKLREFLKEEYTNHVIYPAMEDIFNALHYTPYKDVKVVVLGQDPYHGPGQAHGFSFSVQPDVPLPPSLRNIFKELQADVHCDMPANGNLLPWAKQGVLLLNTVLTVRQGEAHSHRGKGWETFTDKIIETINAREKPAVFILWGRPAQSKLALIDETKHRVIQSVHPSPLSARRGFFGSAPFSQANNYLRELNEKPVSWCLPSE